MAIANIESGEMQEAAENVKKLEDQMAKRAAEKAQRRAKKKTQKSQEANTSASI